MAGFKKGTKKTRFDIIKTMSINEMASFIADFRVGLNDIDAVYCRKLCQYSSKDGCALDHARIQLQIPDEYEPKDCLNIDDVDMCRKWLEMEVENARE